MLFSRPEAVEYFSRGNMSAERLAATATGGLQSIDCLRIRGELGLASRAVRIFHAGLERWSVCSMRNSAVFYGRGLLVISALDQGMR